MGVIERVGRAIAAGESRFDQATIEAEAELLLSAEAPWLGAESVHSVVSGVLGMGPLQPLLDDPDVSDILANGPHEIWADRGSGLQAVDIGFESAGEMVAAVERVIAPLGLRFDRSAPMVDARLADGSRLHAMLPPAAVDFPLLAVRRFTQRVGSMSDLIEAGTVTEEQAGQLAEAVESRQTLVISGGTGAGKTTLLNLLAAFIPDGERIVTIEDAAELALPGHVVRLETRPANTEGFGEITVRALLRSALRLRPDRIILGEVRGPEALDLVSALNTGHAGSLTTVHANSPQEAMWRLETLALSAGDTSTSAVQRQLSAAVDVVVQLDRTSSGRRITAIEDRRID